MPALNQLCVKQENGRYRAVSEEEICEYAAKLIEPKFKLKDVMSTPAATFNYLRLKLSLREHEIFAVLFLDNRHRVIEYKEIFRGTIDGASVHPREVAKDALKCNAAAAILCHNHPSGMIEPSQADIQITKKLQEALKLLDVRVLDHVIVGTEGYCSFAERGML